MTLGKDTREETTEKNWEEVNERGTEEPQKTFCSCEVNSIQTEK